MGVLGFSNSSGSRVCGFGGFGFAGLEVLGISGFIGLWDFRLLGCGGL